VAGIAAVAAVTLGCAVADTGATARAPRARSRRPVAATHADSATTGCTTAPTSLFPCDAAIPGFRGRSVPLRPALRDVPRGLTAELRRASGHAVEFATPARLSKGGAELEVAAWKLSSVDASARTLSRWRAADRRRHPSALGELGFSVGRHGRQPATAVLHVNNVTAELSLKTSMPAAAAQRFLTGAASVEAQQLQATAALTGFDRLSDAVAAHHGPTPRLALEAFALIGGTGSGVPRPIPGGGVIDGTEALGWVFQELPDLSPAQRRAVHRFLARTFPPAHKPSESVADGAAFAEHVDHAITAGDYQAIADQMLTRIEAHTGPLGITPVVSKDPYPKVSDNTVTYALTDLGSEHACDITVFESTDHLELWRQQRVLAHELGHCMQRKYLGYWSLWWKLEVPWIKEGPPEWVADEVAPIPEGADVHTYPEVFLYRWDREPGVSLDQLHSGDDGVGFLGHVADQIGVNTVWSRIPALMSEKETDGGLAALVGSGADEVYNSWGGSYALRGDLGINWERIDPWRDPSAEMFPTAGTPAVVPSGTRGLPARPDTGSLFHLSTTQPLMRVSLSGTVYGRIADEHGHDLALSQTPGQLYCTADDPSNCGQCPPGTEGSIPTSEPLTGDLLVSLSGGASATGGAADFTGIPLSTYCTPTSPTPPTPPTPPVSMQGQGGMASSFGDPHEIDFDGALFDFQQAGEFTLLKSTTHDMQLQVRQQPLGSCCVAYDTAVAMRVGSNTVEVDATGGVHYIVYLDNKRFGRGNADLGGGGHLSVAASRTDSSVTVAWPDGTRVVISSYLPVGVVLGNIAVTLAHDRLGHVAGVFGDWGGSASREFVSRGGRPYPPDVITGTTKHDLKVRYGSFGASWRITQRQSLFDYPGGKSTRSYDVRGFPGKTLTLAALGQASSRRRAGRAGPPGSATIRCCSPASSTSGSPVSAGSRPPTRSCRAPGTPAQCGPSSPTRARSSRRPRWPWTAAPRSSRISTAAARTSASRRSRRPRARRRTSRARPPSRAGATPARRCCCPPPAVASS
jgi:hypothetical protein